MAWIFSWTPGLRAKDEATRQGSDLEHIVKIIRGKGYHLPGGMMYVRLVYLFQDKRKELMIIYAEDAAPTGHSVPELQAGRKGVQLSGRSLRRAFLRERRKA